MPVHTTFFPMLRDVKTYGIYEQGILESAIEEAIEEPTEKEYLNAILFTLRRNQYLKSINLILLCILILELIRFFR